MPKGSLTVHHGPRQRQTHPTQAPTTLPHAHSRLPPFPRYFHASRRGQSSMMMMTEPPLPPMFSCHRSRPCGSPELAGPLPRAPGWPGNGSRVARRDGSSERTAEGAGAQRPTRGLVTAGLHLHLQPLQLLGALIDYSGGFGVAPQPF